MSNAYDKEKYFKIPDDDYVPQSEPKPKPSITENKPSITENKPFITEEKVIGAIVFFSFFMVYILFKS